MIFVNLPVRDLAASTGFYVALGGEVNAQFSDEQATSVMFSDEIGVMLLTHDRYRQFTQRPIGDARRDSQMLLALSVGQRDAVDATLTPAVAAGGRADPNRCRITASCSAAGLRIRMEMSGKSCGWTQLRMSRRSNRLRAAHHLGNDQGQDRFGRPGHDDWRESSLNGRDKLR
jgi:uncharacterized protein